MADRITPASEWTVGIDLGDKLSQVCVLDADAEVVETGSVRTTRKGFQRRFAGMERSRVVLEVGTHSGWVSQLLTELGHEVLVANPRRLKLISQSDSKNDRADAELLARVGRMDPKMLRPIRHRGAQARRDLAVLRSRDLVVRLRADLVNHVRGTVKAFGARLPACSTPSFPKKVRGRIPEELRPPLDAVLETIEHLAQQIRTFDQAIGTAVQEKYPEADHLTQISGVGPLTALAFVLTVEEPARFDKSRTVGAYFGLRPRQGESGEQKPQLRITKAGDKLMRRLLVGSAHYIVGPHGPDTDLRRWGLALAERGGKNAKKRAVVAVARKLAVLMHRLWVTGEVYEPLRNAARSKKVSAASA